MSSEIPVNDSLVYQTQSEFNISMIAEGIQNTSSHPVNTMPNAPYDHLGAMKFTVAVVLVYGVGVIGVLGIYVRRKAKQKQDRDTNTYLKGLQKHHEMTEKKAQLAAVQDVIRSFHGPVPHYKNTPSSTSAATQGNSPVVSVRRYCSDDFPYVSGCPEVRPLMARRHAIPRCFPYAAVGKQQSIPDTEEGDGIVSTGLNETAGSEEVL